MIRALLILSVFVALTMACAPTAPSNSTTAAPAREKRSTQFVTVTVVSNINYDESKNLLNMEFMQNIIAEFAKTQGIPFNVKNMDILPKNQGGKFASVYTIKGVDCEKVQHFVTGAKHSSANVIYVLVKCGSHPQIVIY
uniref:Signal peptide protein n=1 Tax=Heterorhabditis bacteriophora TaxID=37862 RepID=A0A1I7XMC1_HETBA